MATITVLAPAKINLSLDVGAVMPNGYHPVTTVMQAVSLFDEVTVSRSAEQGIRLCCSDAALVCDRRNTALRAALAFEQRFGPLGGIDIYLKKGIPMQAGLAGGSTDAAAVLTALNRLFGSPFSLSALCEMASSVGADVPFCLQGGTQLATGIGTTLSPAPPMPDCALVIAKPAIGVSTAEAYKAIDAAPLCDGTTPAMLAALQSGDIGAVAAALGNRFEKALALPQVSALRDAMLQMGALGAQMSGSGSAVFGIFDNEQKAAACAQALSQQVFVAVCRPLPHGTEG